MKRFNEILTHVLCICLLNWSFATVWNTAYAEGSGSGTDLGSGSQPAPGDTSSFQDCTAMEQDSPEYNACIANLGGSGVDAGSGITDAGDINSTATHQEILMSIFALVIALSAIFFICPNNVSGVLFALGGLLLIIAEVVNWATFTQASEQSLKAVTNVSETDVNTQVAAIDAAKKQTHDAYVWADRRAQFMMWVMIIWIVALVVAIVEGFLKVATWGSYLDSCVGGTAFLNAPPKSKGLYAELYKPNEDDLRAFNREDIEHENVDQLFTQEELDSVFTGSSFQSPSVVDYQAHYQVQNAIAGGLFFEKTTPDSPESIAKTKSMMSKFMEQIFPTAQAGHGEQIIWDILLAAAVTIGLIAFFKGWANAATANGWVRAVFIGVMAGIMGWGFSIAQRKASDLQKREAAYEQLRALVHKKMAGPDVAPPGTTVTTHSGDGTTAPTSTSTESDPGTGLGGCVSGTPSQGSSGGLSNNDCSCASTNSCTTVNTPNPQPIKGIDFPGFEGLSTTPQTVADANNGLSRNKGVGSRFTSTFTPALAAKMKKAAEKLKEKYLDMLRKKGEKNPRSFDDLTKEFKAKVQRDMKAMEAKMTPSLLASLGPLSGGSTGESDKMKDKLKEMGLDQLAKSKGVNLPSLAAPTTAGKLFDDDEAGSGADAATKVENLNTADALSGYETAEQDISKDSGVSIFEQISSRYRRSAFPIFFLKKKDAAAAETKVDEKKPAAPVAAPAHP